MKLCITAVGNTLTAQTDGSFGRAPWFILVETEGDADFEAIKNSGVHAGQGAGIAAAQSIADKGAEGLLTGRVGPKAQAALQAAGVKIYENISRGTVLEALEQFKSGHYKASGDSPAEYGAGCGPGKGLGRGGGGRGMGRGQGRRGAV